MKNNTIGSFDNCQFLGQPVAVSELPDVLNKYFVDITDAVPVLCNNVTANNGLPFLSSMYIKYLIRSKWGKLACVTVSTISYLRTWQTC